MLHLPHHLSTPNSIKNSGFNSHLDNIQPRLPIPRIAPLNKLASFTKRPILLIPRCKPESVGISLSTNVSRRDYFKNDDGMEDDSQKEQGREKNFWGAISLIIGTAVGPGMLGLPAATIRAGSFPSTIAIILCWAYVMSSILIVAELSFAAMQEDGVEEVSFTGLATKALGSHFGAVVAVVYASLSFSLLVACVSGIGSIVSQWFPWMNLVLAQALFPIAVGIVIGFFPFKANDTANRFFCLLMLLSITALVAIGLSVARTNVLGSFGLASWSFSSILPAIPVTVLTLGFHVITPFICKIAGTNLSDTRKAILVGGAVPLMMVLSWNLIVLGLAGANRATFSNDPISLLLSVNPKALSAVQGFAFSALATSLIGYAVSFPKQLVDTLGLIFDNMKPKEQTSNQSVVFSNRSRSGRVGQAVFSVGNAGEVSFDGSSCYNSSAIELQPSMTDSKSSGETFVTLLVLAVAILIGSFARSTFARALAFAGVYANCFLFGILPPIMAYIQQSRKKLRSSILPGGDMVLLLLFGISVILAIWH